MSYIELDVRDRILVAIFCKAGVLVPYSRHQDAEINEKQLVISVTMDANSKLHKHPRDISYLGCNKSFHKSLQACC